MNIPELERLLYDFYQVSGMEVAIVDSKLHNLFANRVPGKNYCAAIHKSAKCLEICINSDREHLQQVFESRRLLTYVCPFGIFEAIAPIMKNGEVEAYLFFAMGMEDREGCDELPLRRATELSPALDADYLRQCIIEIPHYSRKRLEAYADLLLIMAEYIEKNDLLADHNKTLGELIKLYVKKNLNNKITLADMSWNLHCSTVTLTEHFKKEFGITIRQYVTQKRMEQAKEMLLNTTMPIGDIATMCGFPDVEYFSRTFKSSYGISPNRWRKTQNIEG